jgi:hypothetical protein
MHRIRLALLALPCAALTACLPDLSDDPVPRATYAEAMAIAESLAAGLREGMQAFRDPAAAPALTPAADSACQPDKLVPPQNCADGGNIYTTINLRCSEPSGCCANDPPCEADEVNLAGQFGTVYNSCRIKSDGHSIVLNGSLTGNLTSEFIAQCSGLATASLKFVYVGRPSITVDGREACPGGINLTLQAFVGASITITMSGSVCEWPIQAVYDEGCLQTCADGHCCPAGAVCGTVSEGACFAPGYTVDCGGGRACPTGTTCVDGGEQCSY